MSSLDKLYEDILAEIEIKYRKFYNFHQLTIFNQRTQCYKSFPEQPNQYY
jgi:hypothetical protein